MKMTNAIILVAAMILSLAAYAGAASYKLTEKPLNNSIVQIYNFGDIKLHAFQSNDVMADENFLLETAAGLVAIESPAFKADVETW